MTLEQLRVFVAVAERQHMTQAADALNIAQSAVSATVAALEAEFGARLFDRVGRTIRLTAFGLRCLDESGALLAQAERIHDELISYARSGNAEAVCMNRSD